MFDSLIFDSGRFDRESNNTYEGYIHGDGKLICQLEVICPFANFMFMGVGALINVLTPFAIISGCEGNIIEGNQPGQGGNGGLELTLVMELDSQINGVGTFDIFNFGDIKTDVLYLRDISLLPGKTITIDTDLMTVLFGFEHDVSSLTDDSIFFELNEGTNEIKFEITYEFDPNPIPANELETTFIWQNRWL